MKLHLSTQDRINSAIKQLAEIEPNGEYQIEIKRLPHKRTLQQNKSLHLFKGFLAKELNKAGLTAQEVLAQAVDIEWTPEMVLELLWRRLQIVITGKKSTTEPTPEEYIEIYETLNRHIGSKFGVHVPWPVDKTRG